MSRPLTDTEYLHFEERPAPGITRRIAVSSMRHGDCLGLIRWFGRWRQYVFEPSNKTVFNVVCLRDLADKLGYLNTMHRGEKTVISSNDKAEE